MTLRQYDPTQIALTWGDIDLTEGMANGQFLSETINTPRVATKPAGPAGIPTRVVSPDDSRTIAVTLDQESRTHKVLRQIATAGASGGASPVYDLTLSNFATGEKVIWRQAFIIGQPGESRGTDTSTVQWSFYAVSASYAGGVAVDEV